MSSEYFTSTKTVASSPSGVETDMASRTPFLRRKRSSWRPGECSKRILSTVLMKSGRQAAEDRRCDTKIDGHWAKQIEDQRH